MNKWTDVLAGQLPSGLSKITLNVTFRNDDDDGTLGGASNIHVIKLISSGNYLPNKGDITFNTFYGVSRNTIIHEVGHVLGIGILWDEPNYTKKILIDKISNSNKFYVGENAVREYRNYIEQGGGTQKDSIIGIPIEDDGGSGTQNYHPEEGDVSRHGSILSTNNRIYNNVFHPGLSSEIMTGWSTGGNELSRITIGFLEDLGYTVDYTVADEYILDVPELLPIIE